MEKLPDNITRKDMPPRNDRLYHELSLLIESQSKMMNEAIDEFHAGANTLEQKSLLNKKLIKYLEVILDAEGWDKTTLLRNVIQPYKDIYAKALEDRNKFEEQLAPPEVLRQKISANEVEVFITLYQIDGYDLVQWNRQLKMLLQSNLSRPIYITEDGVATVMRARLMRPNDAYIVAIIAKDNVLDLDPALLQEDSHGQKIIYLTDHALSKKTFIEFVHLNNRYPIRDGVILAEHLL